MERVKNWLGERAMGLTSVMSARRVVSGIENKSRNWVSLIPALLLAPWSSTWTGMCVPLYNSITSSEFRWVWPLMIGLPWKQLLRTTRRQILTHPPTHTPVHRAKLNVVVLVNLHQQPMVDVTVKSSNCKLRIKVKVLYFSWILGQKKRDEKESKRLNQGAIQPTR